MFDAKNYLERVKAMVSRLEQLEDIVVESFEIRPSATQANINHAKAYT